MIKRLFDVIASISGIIVTGPLMVSAAVLIKLTSPGSIFYRAKRAGKGNKPFYMYKFRTMTQNADRKSTITVGKDSRITWVGSVLRKAKIDEFPQFFNVLKGEMSIVGPRPEDWNIVENYYSEEDLELLTILPGIACPGQIYYYLFQIEEVPPEGMDAETFYIQRQLPIKLAYDMHYVQNSCLFYDFKIIFFTAAAIMSVVLHKKIPWKFTPAENYNISFR
jgi:lipopolysaccharide/colanic/teichoic acid biosynthesis glycosyltransferase